MIRNTLEVRIGPDIHGRPLATLEGEMGWYAELAPACRRYGPLGQAFTFTDSGDSA